MNKKILFCLSVNQVVLNTLLGYFLNEENVSFIDVAGQSLLDDLRRTERVMASCTRRGLV
jgi:hypothetical protein